MVMEARATREEDEEFLLVFQFQWVSFLMEFRTLGNADEHIMDNKQIQKVNF